MGLKSEKTLNKLLKGAILERNRYIEVAEEIAIQRTTAETRIKQLEEEIKQLNEKVQNLEISALASAADAMRDKRNQQEQIDRLKRLIGIGDSQIDRLEIAIADKDSCIYAMIEKRKEMREEIERLTQMNQRLRNANYWVVLGPHELEEENADLQKLGDAIGDAFRRQQAKLTW
jgi:GTPase involved in cell partitioning and DNA repair